ncbi:hypothetical protein FRC09_016614 [Ceratobasidium sp. 395]|nr:hypothetical protein FRC09_016614 [Ceratobasidium sp. 395]
MVLLELRTFGSVLALLSESQRPHLGTTTLYIVPHRDLAYQIESWCQKLLPKSSSTESLASHVQVLVRPNVDSSLLSIKNTPPRILIATPGALIDAMLHPEHPLKLHLSLERIIVDEFDVVMNIPLRYRVVRESRRHQPEAAQAIDRILEDIWRMKRPKPQMVMMGATLWLHVRKWLFAQNGWMAEHVVRLDGVKAEQGEDDEIVSSSNDKVVHSAVVVNPNGTLRNAKTAGENELGIEPGILTHKPSLVLEALSNDETADTYAHARDSASDSPPAVASRAPKHSISPSVFEAIATSIALDVTNRAMCVVPAGTSVVPIVEKFCKLGVDARLLNLRDDIDHISRPNDEAKIEISSPTTTSAPVLSQEENISESVAKHADEPRHELVSNPVLLVTTTAAVRGLDIPTLSHVYIVGGVESLGLYRHIAGRVGRFGKPGTVVLFIGVIGTESPVGNLAGERRLQNIYKQIGAKVVPFAHIQ